MNKLLNETQNLPRLKDGSRKKAENERILEIKIIGGSLRKKHRQRQDSIRNGEWLLPTVYITQIDA